MRSINRFRYLINYLTAEVIRDVARIMVRGTDACLHPLSALTIRLHSWRGGGEIHRCSRLAATLIPGRGLETPWAVPGEDVTHLLVSDRRVVSTAVQTSTAAVVQCRRCQVQVTRQLLNAAADWSCS